MYTPIIATLGYVFSKDATTVLMIHRNTRLDDQHYGKYNGLGGKIEPNEDIVTGMKRELHEEAGIDALSPTLRGTINWPGFGLQGEDWFGFIFCIYQWRGTPILHNHEGVLEWVPIDHMLSLPLWPGDRLFLPLVLGEHPGQFHGIMAYDGEEPVEWRYVWI